MRVLLVEDDAKIARLVGAGLREEGHVVDVVDRGADALEQLRWVDYEVVILDWMLPDIDGLTVLRQLRERASGVPVLMLTARGSVGERVAGLRAGADDYLVKPFAFAELVARVDALHRRAGGGAVRLEVGDVRLDHSRRALCRGDEVVELTGREHALARALFDHPGEVRTRTELISEVWGEHYAGEPNVVDVYVGYLRRKLERLGAAARIETVRGVGFRLRGEAV
ncbi:MAG: hypothetical protein RIT45_83 [Pseudomonadota bacterium]